MCAENAMTVHGEPHDRHTHDGGTIMRVYATHYAQAVQQFLEDAASDLRPDLTPEEEGDLQAVADADREGWDLACDYYKSIKVYRGHLRDDETPITTLTLIHEE